MGTGVRGGDAPFEGRPALLPQGRARVENFRGRKFSAFARRKPTGLSSAEMAALMCIAAARTGFLLAALHSVAERVNPRKARPPAPHGPRVLAGANVPKIGRASCRERV